MFWMLKKKKDYHVYISKRNSNYKKQVILLMILNGEKCGANCEGRWRYVTVKNLSALLRRMTSKFCGNFYCLICFHSLRIKSKLELHKKVCQNKDFCNLIIPSEDNKTLEFNQYQETDKVSIFIYADPECIIEKIDECENNPENSSTAKVSKQIQSSFSMSTTSSFRSIENKHDVYRGQDFMKMFYESLREHAMKIINFKKKKIKLLTKEQ